MNRPTDYMDFDEVVVGRLVAGRHPGEPIRAADAGEATRRPARQGYSDGQIAVRLGFRRRSVIRIRARLDIPAALTPNDNQMTRAHDAPARPRAKG
ncbi:hypothetical protein [Actinoplanes palleronii]|uniref:Uncharacterized protein n=1 Tax=Actinoplanes palleronii TaxID=113570 RepID=A0ABQ4BJG4_9ACTN|nr:hypothetical protein [Actinoplanes palleronii]GIE70752.1 hypothetical protein Apa02nite_068600 [Actinoplanes palleronii]